MNLSPIVSPLTQDKDRVEVGTKIVYSDVCNYNKYTVTAVDGDEFTAVSEDGEEIVKSFENLQYGWSIVDEQE